MPGRVHTRESWAGPGCIRTRAGPTECSRSPRWVGRCPSLRRVHASPRADGGRGGAAGAGARSGGGAGFPRARRAVPGPGFRGAAGCVFGRRLALPGPDLPRRTRCARLCGAGATLQQDARRGVEAAPGRCGRGAGLLGGEAEGAPEPRPRETFRAPVVKREERDPGSPRLVAQLCRQAVAIASTAAKQGAD